MINQIIGALATFVTTLFLVVFVYFQNSESLVNKSYSIYNFFVALWSFCYFKMITATTPEISLFWSRALHIGTIFIPITFLHFSLVLLNLQTQKKRILIAGYSLAVLFLAFYFSPLFITGVKPIFFFNYFVVVGPIHYLFTIFFFSYVIYTEYILFRGFKATKGIKSMQIKYVFWAYLLAYTGGISAFLPAYNIAPLPLGLYPIPLGMLIVTYAIIRHQLMDIRIASVRVGLSFLVFTPILLSPLFLMSGKEETIIKLLGKKYWYYLALLESILVTGGIFIFNKLRVAAEAKIHAQENKRVKELNQLFEEIEQLDLVEEFCKLTGSKIKGITKSLAIAIFASLEGKDFKLVYNQGDNTFKLPDNLASEDLLVSALRVGKDAVTLESLVKLNPDVAAALENLGGKVAIPCLARKALRAIIILGKKAKEADEYDLRELLALRLIANPLAGEIDHIGYVNKQKYLARGEIKAQWKEMQDIFHRASSWFSQVRSIKGMSLLIMYLAMKLAKVKDCQVYIFNEDSHKFMVTAVHGKGKGFAGTPMDDNHPLADLLKQTKYPLMYEDITRLITKEKFATLRQVLDRANDMGAQLIVPLLVTNKLLGFIVLCAEDVRAKIYTDDDIKILAMLGNYAALAIQFKFYSEDIIKDVLTQLYNRRYFSQRILEEIERALREKYPLSLLFIDIDKFKRLNDTYGHGTADRVLKKVAQILKKCCRHIDLPCRFGGEELILILPHANLDKAKLIAERVRAAVEQEIIASMPELKESVSVSIGISVLEVEDILKNNPKYDLEAVAKDLILKADKQMYIAKESGRNRVCWQDQACQSHEPITQEKDEEDEKKEEIQQYLALDKLLEKIKSIPGQRYDSILAVEDEENTLRLLEQIYKRNKINYYLALDIRTARQIYNQYQQRILAVSLDIGLPDGKGTILMEEFPKINPQILFLILSGFTHLRQQAQIWEQT